MTFNSEPFVSSPASTVISMKRGDDVQFDVTVSDSVTGLPIDIAGLPMWFTAKRSYFDDDPDAQILKDTTGGGIAIIDSAGGVARVIIDAADTDALEARTTFRWDVQWQDSNGAIHTISQGDLVVELDVTRRTS